MYPYSYTINSLNEAIDVFLSNSKNAPKSKNAFSLMYRGHSSVEYLLQPSIFRENRLNNEAQMIQELKRLSPFEFPSSNSDVENLIKMQHYGLPTRLLDFSLNPLVALYFACQISRDESKKNDDGEIIVFYEKIEQINSPIVKKYAKLSTYEGKNETNFKQLIGLKTPSTLESLDEIVKMLNNAMKKDYSKKVIFIPAIHNNERIRRQNGVFMFFGIDITQDNPYEKHSFVYDKKDLIPQYGGMKVRIVVPAKVKSEILSDLDALGINHGFLFPELEHQAFYIDQKFSQKAETISSKRKFRVLH